MTHWKHSLSALGLLVACSGASGPSDEQNLGNLAVELTGVDSHGETYRLRNASFSIYGYPDYYYPSSGSAGAAGSSDGDYYYSEVVTTESDPSVAVITRRVVPGSYSVVFDTDQPWYLEHVTSHGAERVSQAILLSSPTRWAYVYDRGSTSVSFQFGVDGRTIDFRHGDLTIRIGIEHPNEGGGGASSGGWGGEGGAAL